METLFREKYKISNAIIRKVNNMEALAKVIIKCRIIDDRTITFNRMGFDFEELLYNQLLDLKDCFCAELLYLVEYSLYFQQRKPNNTMFEMVNEAIDFMIITIKETKEERKRCRYNKIIDIIKKYEKDFYNESLKGMNEEEKNQHIKDDIINNSGELLYNLQYYKLTHDNSEKVEDYWKIIMKLVRIIDVRGKQQEIKKNEEMEGRIKKKVLKYMQMKNT